MEIVRGASRQNFTQVHNDTVRDRELSWRARGILFWLLSLPPGWKTDSTKLAEASKSDGRDAVRAGLSELEREGYLVRKQFRDDAGRWQTQWSVHEAPVAEDQRTWTPPKQRVRKPNPQATETAGQHQDGSADAVSPTRSGRVGDPGALKKTDTKTEKKSSSSSAQARAQAPRPSRAQQDQTLIPDGWEPSAATMAWARAERPDVNLGLTLGKYVDHRTKKRQKAVDWDEDFKAWVLRERGDDSNVIDLRAQQPEPMPNSSPGRPEWCGECDEYDRTWESADGRLHRCPTCHPRTAGAF